MQHGLCDDGVAGLGASRGQNTENPEVVTEQHTAMNRTLNSTYSMKPDLSRSVSRMSVSMSSVSPNSWRCHACQYSSRERAVSRSTSGV